jgi:PilZ domain-containing protein
VSKGQLAILPLPDGRTAERRIVNLAARLREPGATIVDAEVLDLSTDGYMAVTALALETGTTVWLKLPGLEPQNSRVVWAEDGKAGFQFAAPLHQATIDMLVKASRKPLPRRHFGPQA